MTSWACLLNRRSAVLALALLVFTAQSPTRPAAGQSANETVRLVVDYGDGATKTISNLAWAKGNTVLDAMKAAILTKIDDVQNQGGGADKKNWQYWVNGANGDKSFAVFELQAQDVIVWRFAAEQGK